MKKYLGLLVLAILVCSVALSACGNTATATTAKNRWESEKLTFKISLADFAADPESSSVFQSYVYNDVEYFKDRMMSGETAPSAKDEIIPQNLTGSFVCEIVGGADTATFTTKQTIFARYNPADFTAVSDMSAARATEEEENGAFGNVSTTLVTLKSVTETSVKFMDTEATKTQKSQQPLESSTTVNGYYMGKQHQGTSSYSVSTVYDIANSKATVTIDGKTEERELDVKSGVNFIDANQLWLYVRSLEKHKDNFADSPTTVIYQPYSATTSTASFGFAYESPTYFTLETATNQLKYHVKTSSVSVYLNGNAFMFTESLPDKLASADLDFMFDGAGTKTSKYSILCFRSGFTSYTLTSALVEGEETFNAPLLSTLMSLSQEEK